MVWVLSQLLQAIYGPFGTPILPSQYGSFVSGIVKAYVTALDTLYAAGGRKFLLTVSAPLLAIATLPNALCHLEMCLGSRISSSYQSLVLLENRLHIEAAGKPWPNLKHVHCTAAPF